MKRETTYCDICEREIRIGKYQTLHDSSCGRATSFRVSVVGDASRATVECEGEYGMVFDVHKECLKKFLRMAMKEGAIKK